MQVVGSNILPFPVLQTSKSKDGVQTQVAARYCPTMDLIAIFAQTLPSEAALEAVSSSGGDDNDDYDYYAEDEDEVVVDVYRLSGQKVFTIGVESNNGAIGVVDVGWRSDGVILAIVTSDSVVRLVNSFSGKVVQTFSSVSALPASTVRSRSQPSSPTSKRKSMGPSEEVVPRKRRCMPTAIECSTHFTDSKMVRRSLKVVEEEKGTMLDELLSLNADVEGLLQLKPDMPREFANIDVEQYLPKLAVLPANGLGEDDVFSTRTSIDTMFHPQKQHAGSLSTDIVAVAQNDGQIHLRIFDSFEVGDVDLSSVLDTAGRVKRIVTHPFLDKLYVIVDAAQPESPSKHTRAHREDEQAGSELHLLSLDLRFLSTSSHGLPILATKATQLHNLARYLRQIESQLSREVKTAFDLPMRFLRALDVDLEEQDGPGSTFETSAYHALLTGEVSGKFKEWLNDVLGDRGVKRWEKAVGECLDLVRRLTSENWGPAVERAGIVVSALAGLVDADSEFEVEKGVLDGLRDVVDVMGILGEEVVGDVVSEGQGFTAFMKWLKREVEMAGLEDTSEKLDEMREGSEHGEVRKVFGYVGGRLRETSVKKYIGAGATVGNEGDMDGVGFYDRFKRARREGKDQEMLSMKALSQRLTALCERLFQQVGGKLREKVLIETVCSLGRNIDPEMMDVSVVLQPEYPTLLVAGSQRSDMTKLLCMEKSLEAVQRSHLLSERNIQPGSVFLESVLDVKLVDADKIFVLGRGKVGGSEQVATQVVAFGLDGKTSTVVKHRFEGEHDLFVKNGLKPCRMDVNARQKRRTLTVVDQEGRGYAVFDLDSLDDDASDNMQD